MGELYEDDVLLWSERQSELLRRLAAGERLNDQVDWENVAEEIESVGRNELRACASLLQKALEHRLKALAWPQSREVPTWRAEVISFRQQAADAFTPSMRQRLDIDRLYRRALRALPETIDGRAPLPLPEACDVTLDELLAEEP